MKKFMKNDNELVIVFSGNSIEAGILKGLLEDAGIEVFLKDEMTGIIAPYAATPGGVAPVKVTVSKKDLDKVKPIIEKFLEKT